MNFLLRIYSINIINTSPSKGHWYLNSIFIRQDVTMADDKLFKPHECSRCFNIFSHSNCWTIIWLGM